MKITLSHAEISSFRCNVVPLWLESDEPIDSDEIRWFSTRGLVSVRTFADDTEFPFADGVLLTLSGVGDDTVCCYVLGHHLECVVHIRERRHDSDPAALRAFPADTHMHSSLSHSHAEFALEPDLRSELIRSCHESGVLTCSAITDHACVTNSRAFFEGFVRDDRISHDGMIVFPGAESEITLIEKDRYGLPHKNSGELVTLNANSFSFGSLRQKFASDLADSPFAVIEFAHPLVVGWDLNGIWNFKFRELAKNAYLRRNVKLLEVTNGDGLDRGTDFLNIRAYSQALDCGFKLAPCSVSDSHGRYAPIERKTMLLASEESKEMFYDALVSCRVYSCESGKVALDFRVNGAVMGETLPLCDEYNFSLTATVIGDCTDAAPTSLRVISDYGLCVYAVAFDRSAEFTLTSSSARYFYIELYDRAGRRTVSAPIFTGREYDDYNRLDKHIILDKSHFTATDRHGNDASELICDNPRRVWQSDSDSDQITIDMHREQYVSVLGHYTPALYRHSVGSGETLEDAARTFTDSYTISASSDGVHFIEIRRGIIREYGGEELIDFPPIFTRYIRFDAVSYGGKLRIGELSLFE